MEQDAAQIIQIVERIPTELIGSLMASTTLMKIEVSRLRAAGKNGEARAIEVQVEANDDILARHSEAAGF